MLQLNYRYNFKPQPIRNVWVKSIFNFYTGMPMNNIRIYQMYRVCNILPYHLINLTIYYIFTFQQSA